MSQRRRSSYLTEEQQDWLESKLAARPSRGSQIYNTVVGSKSAAARQLERNMAADRLNQQLYSREEPDARVLKGENVAPRLRQARLSLEVAMTKDRVGHLLEQRSDLNELSHQNIIRDPSIAPAIQKNQADLQRNLAKSNLYHALKHRPSIVELQERGIYKGEGEYDSYDEEGYDDEYDYDDRGQQSYAPQDNYESSVYQRRSKNFHLTRILLKFVASMAEAGEISLAQKGYLKDLIVDQDKTILAVAETFDAENDLHDFKDSLTRLASRSS